MTDYAPPAVAEDLPTKATESALARSGQIGRLLYENGKLSAAEVDKVVELQRKNGMRFGEAAVKLRYVNAEDVRMALAHQFSYPVVPVANTRLDRSLVAALRPHTARVEAMRGLRSELMLRYFDDPAHRVLPTICIDDGDGAGKLLANLAIVFSQLGARTLMIDANLRKPMLHDLFNIRNGDGLSDILASRGTVAPHSCSPFESLWLLNAGTPAPNPQELLAKKRYRNLCSKLAEQFDVILVNTPPLSESQDAQLIANRAGAALWIVREHSTPLKSLDQYSRRLQEVGVNLLGVAVSQ